MVDQKTFCFTIPFAARYELLISLFICLLRTYVPCNTARREGLNAILLSEGSSSNASRRYVACGMMSEIGVCAKKLKFLDNIMVIVDLKDVCGRMLIQLFFVQSHSKAPKLSACLVSDDFFKFPSFHNINYDCFLANVTKISYSLIICDSVQKFSYPISGETSMEVSQL